jgi:hypothetical protein
MRHSMVSWSALARSTFQGCRSIFPHSVAFCFGRSEGYYILRHVLKHVLKDDICLFIYLFTIIIHHYLLFIIFF